MTCETCEFCKYWERWKNLYEERVGELETYYRKNASLKAALGDVDNDIQWALAHARISLFATTDKSIFRALESARSRIQSALPKEGDTNG